MNKSLAFLFLLHFSCKTKEEKKIFISSNYVDSIRLSSKINHFINVEGNLACKCPSQFDLRDSAELIQIKDLFYISKTGHLYNRTIAQKESGNLNSLKWNEYFNGYFPQEVDPLTFESLDGWYAKDKNFVYYYRPISGGMLIVKIDNADCKTFEILKGHYKYAKDKNFFYDESSMIKGFTSKKSTVLVDKKGRVTGIKCDNKTNKFELETGNDE